MAGSSKGEGAKEQIELLCMLKSYSFDFCRYVWPIYFSVSAAVLWSNYMLSVLCERGHYPQITDLNMFIFVISIA